MRLPTQKIGRESGWSVIPGRKDGLVNGGLCGHFAAPSSHTAPRFRISMVGHDLHRLSEPDPDLEQQFSAPRAFIVLLMVFFSILIKT